MQNQELVRHSDKICAKYAIENTPNNPPNSIHPSEQSEKNMLEKTLLSVRRPWVGLIENVL